MNGKGSKQRPTDIKKYRKNYDKVFKKSKDKLAKKVADEANVHIDPESGAINISNKGGTISTREKKIVIKREFVDQNGVEMVIVNIDDALTNTTMSKRQLKVIQHEIVNEQHPDAVKAVQDEKLLEDNVQDN